MMLFLELYRALRFVKAIPHHPLRFRYIWSIFGLWLEPADLLPLQDLDTIIISTDRAPSLSFGPEPFPSWITHHFIDLNLHLDTSASCLKHSFISCRLKTITLPRSSYPITRLMLLASH